MSALEPGVWPAIMTPEHVRALQGGRKTQTRRMPTPMWAKAHIARAGGRRVLLWVREPLAAMDLAGKPWYRADWQPRYGGGPRRWRPAMLCPRASSRITLEVRSIELQDLQAITPADADAEGTEDEYGRTGLTGFVHVWNALHGRPGERWRDNPTVYAIAFAVHPINVDALLAAEAHRQAQGNLWEIPHA